MSDETSDDLRGDAADATSGDAGDELRGLLEGITEWARRALPAPPSGHPRPECQWCPLCQLASVLRGEHPEITDRVAEAGAAITQALLALAESAGSRAPGAGTSRRPKPGPRADPRVQHIPLRDPRNDRPTEGQT